jgi:hypothetical protein
MSRILVVLVLALYGAGCLSLLILAAKPPQSDRMVHMAARSNLSLGTATESPVTTVTTTVSSGVGSDSSAIGLLPAWAPLTIINSVFDTGEQPVEWVQIEFPPNSVGRGWIPASAIGAADGEQMLMADRLGSGPITEETVMAPRSFFLWSAAGAITTPFLAFGLVAAYRRMAAALRAVRERDTAII